MSFLIGSLVGPSLISLVFVLNNRSWMNGMGKVDEYFSLKVGTEFVLTIMCARLPLSLLPSRWVWYARLLCIISSLEDRYYFVYNIIHAVPHSGGEWRKCVFGRN